MYFATISTYTAIDVPGATHTQVRDINDRGHIVGEYFDGSKWRGYIYDGSTYTSFDYPAATHTFVGGINDAGEINGVYQQYGRYHGFIATPVLMYYEFDCYYNDGDGDYYSGYFYDYLDYGVGDHILAFTDENDQPGYYEITGKTVSSDGMAGQVFVDSYYDVEKNRAYVPTFFWGDNYLGSEYGYINITEYPEKFHPATEHPPGIAKFFFGNYGGMMYEADVKQDKKEKENAFLVALDPEDTKGKKGK